MSRRGFFITLEGTDGTGKSTQARRLAAWLTRKGRSVVLTREPGGGPLAEKIRKILLDPRVHISSMAELFLYEAARADHVARIIGPALKKGRWVICDRFTDATLAYQGAARGLPFKHIDQLNTLATGNLKPDVTLWLDLPPARGFARAGKRKAGHDRIEKEGLAFQSKVRRGYQLIARRDPRRILRIAVQNSIEGTEALIQNALKSFL